MAKTLRKRRKKEPALFVSFDKAQYLERLKLMREVISGDDKTAFAKLLGIPRKRWSNYEAGYPIPREVAFLLWYRLDISTDWLWYGADGKLPEKHKKKMEAAKDVLRQERVARSALERAEDRVKKISEQRKKILQADNG